MSVYPKQVNELLRWRRGWREPEVEPSAEGADARFECGCFVRVAIWLNDDGVISEARTTSNGCGYMRAAAEFLCESIGGVATTELGGLGAAEMDIAAGKALGGIPADRKDCVGAACGAIRAAFSDLRLRRTAEFAGEKALICTCFGVAEDDLREIISARPDAELDDVMDECRAGTGCGACRQLIVEIIDSQRRG